jgi:hypothetical protein
VAELSGADRIILVMRRWFVVLLLLLLPWRAWAGDAMVLSMQLPSSGPAAHCLDHGDAPASVSQGTSAAASADGPVAAHAICDICNGPAMAASWLGPVMGDEVPSAHLNTGPERFDSALSRPGHKPPIS